MTLFLGKWILYLYSGDHFSWAGCNCKRGVCTRAVPFFDLGRSTLRELTKNILFLRSADCQEVWSVRWQMKMDAFTFRESRLLRNNWWSSKPPDGVRKTSKRHPQCMWKNLYSFSFNQTMSYLTVNCVGAIDIIIVEMRFENIPLSILHIPD